MILVRQILCAGLIVLLYACSGGGSSYEFNSAKMYARIDKDLKAAEEWGLKALELQPNNALIPYFLATEVYKPMKKQGKVAEMYIEALGRTENLILDRPFKSGEVYVNNVPDAIRVAGEEIYGEGVKLFEKKKKNKAIIKFELALKLMPDFLGTYTTLSTIYMVDKEYEKALEYINEGLKIDTYNTDLKLRKAECLARTKSYDEAIAILNTIEAGDELIKINIDKQIFDISLETEDYLEAAELGNLLVEKMFITLGVSEDEIAVVCYNVAYCNFQLASVNHDKALNILNSGTEDSARRLEAVEFANKAIKYYEEAKGRFYDSSSYNPDDSNSLNKAKELNQSIKQLENIIIPGLTN